MQAGLLTLVCAEAFATTISRPDMAAFNVPTLIIHGTDDVRADRCDRTRVGEGHSQLAHIEYDGAPHGLLATRQGTAGSADIASFALLAFRSPSAMWKGS